MHKTQKVLGQISRTLLKHQIQSDLNKQPQQKLITLTCHLIHNTPDSESLFSKRSLIVRNPAQNYSKFTAAREGLPLAGTQLICEERALDLISNLKETELAAIKLALKKYEAKKQKEAFEGEFLTINYLSSCFIKQTFIIYASLYFQNILFNFIYKLSLNILRNSLLIVFSSDHSPVTFNTHLLNKIHIVTHFIFLPLYKQ